MMMRDLASRLMFERTVSNFMLELTKLKTKAHMVTNCGSVPIFFRDAPILCMYLNHAVKKFFVVALLHTTCLYQRRGENASASYPACSRITL
jgi:nitric oxide reductase large subunit